MVAPPSALAAREEEKNVKDFSLERSVISSSKENYLKLMKFF